MRKNLSKILVTGGAGFIGSAFVKGLLSRKGAPELIVVDKLTYAGDLERLREVKEKYKFYRVDICDKPRIDSIFKKERPDAVVNFAASTHVDRSIVDATPFIETNVRGTQVLLDASRRTRVGKLVHLSTDEVYGDIMEGKFNENSGLKPNSPYAASKASADLLIKSYIRTYNFPAVILRPSNNYGPWQYPEKLIPVIIYHALKNKGIPIYAKGLNAREWLYVSDCAEAIRLALENSKPAEIYNIGSGCEERNINVAKRILDILGKPHSLIKFVADRPGHDCRYALDSTKIRKLGWAPRADFESQLKVIVEWYKQNLSWLELKLNKCRQ